MGATVVDGVDAALVGDQQHHAGPYLHRLEAVTLDVGHAGDADQTAAVDAHGRSAHSAGRSSIRDQPVPATSASTSMAPK